MSPLNIKNTREAQDKGICMIHQELNMMNHLTVAQNIFIGREKSNGIFLDDRALNEASVKLLETLGIAINPKELLGNLTVGIAADGRNRQGDLFPLEDPGPG